MQSLLPHMTAVLAFASIVLLHADPADVPGSYDYPGFPRVPGYILTDYDEDNPAEFDFPISRPQPLDASHVEMIHVHGHRYIIRYELAPDTRPTSIVQTQLFYEKLATAAGFIIKKSGAVGDVTETFRGIQDGRVTWVYLEPAITSNTLTIMQASEPLPSPPHTAVNALPVTPAPPAQPEPAPTPTQPARAPSPALTGDALYAQLTAQGRMVVPIDFIPGRQEPNAASQPVIDSIIDMMTTHPEVFLRIESHTDSTGDPNDNLRLSGQRAYAIRTALIAARIAPNRLDAVGVGGLQPIADNATAEGRAKNRRIELVIKKKFSANTNAVQ